MKLYVTLRFMEHIITLKFPTICSTKISKLLPMSKVCEKGHPDLVLARKFQKVSKSFKSHKIL